MNAAQTPLDRVAAARTGEDLFGANDGERARRAARRTLLSLRAQLHPDRALLLGLAPETARAAFARVGELHRTWLAGTGSTAGPTPGATTDPAAVVVGDRADHRLGDLLATGTWSTLYRSHDGAVAKVARSGGSGRLVGHAATALRTLGDLTATGDHTWLRPYYPRLLDVGTVTFGTTTSTTRTSTSQQRAALVLDDLSTRAGFVTLDQVLAAHPGGLDGRDCAWMMRRLLRALAGAHSVGLVHGAVLPGNVLLHPSQHGVVLAGWGMSTTTGAALPARVGSALAAYSPEAAGTVTPAHDIWMLAGLMQRMLRPQESRQLRFARGCRQVAPGMRPTAVDLMAEYDDLLERTYGPRTFRPFAMPATADTDHAPAAAGAR